MNILVVSHYGIYSDLTCSFVHAQAAAYAALGHRVRVIVPIAVGKNDRDGKRLSAVVKERTYNGVEVVYVRFLSLSNFGDKHFNAVSAISILRCKWKTVMRDFQPDVIHAHTLGLDSEVGVWLKKRLHIPLVVTTHGSDTFVPYQKDQKALLKQYTVGADMVVCVSTLLKKRLLECGTTVPMTVILNGFNVQHTEVSKDKDPFSVIQAGYLVPRKNADITIRAHALLRNKYPTSTLKIVGSGSELTRFQELCVELGVNDSTRFYGFLPNDETLAQMATSRFFVMPSVREGFGIVYLEAMANECVTIGTEGEGIADLIVSGENGFLVPPNDPNAIVQVVDWCIANPEQATAVAKRGRQSALELTWERNAKTYLALFSEKISK